MKKRILAVLLTLCMALSLLPAGVLADDAPTSGTCGEQAVWKLENGVLTISGAGAVEFDMEDFWSLSWQNSAEAIEKIVIEEGIVEIGEGIFGDLENLTQLTLPESLKSIGYEAIMNCNALTSVTIPAGVKQLGVRAFGYCTNLILRVDENNPYYSAVDGILFNKDKTELIQYPIAKKDPVYTIPDTVETIGTTAFIMCDNLTGVTIPDSVTSIEFGAFCMCENLVDITFSGGAAYVGGMAFDGTAYMADESHWKDNALYMGNCLIRVKEDISGDFTVRDGTKAIAGAAFTDCAGLAGVVIPGSVQSIGEDAFSGCKELTEITIPKGVRKIGEFTFSMSGLKKITIPNSVVSIEMGAFSCCVSLEDVYFAGDKTEWEHISIANDWNYNDTLLNATIHYNAEMPKPPTPPDPCADGHTWDDGTITKQPTATEPGERTYTCTLCGATKIEEIPATGGTETPPAPDVPAVRFTDVAAGAYYADAVSWAVFRGITTGTTETTFSPEAPCTRAQAVTFLWRAAGRPEPGLVKNPFVDVADTPDTNWCYQAILWAVEQGITNGVSETEFGPETTCSRAQIVTFLHRYAGNPAASGDSFNDVPTGEYYYAPVIWAASKGLTNGTGNGNFSPMDNCTRGQIVTFLYRDMVG